MANSFRRPSVSEALLTLALSAAGGVLVAIQPLALGAVVVVVLLVGLLVVAMSRPLVVGYLAMAGLVLFPYVAAPTVRFFVLQPGLLLLWLVGLALAASRSGTRHAVPGTLLDAAVGLFFVMLALSSVTGVNSFSSFAQSCFLWLGPYVAGRFLYGAVGSRGLLRMLVFGAGLLFPFLAYEAATGDNLFLHIPGAVDTVSGLGTIVHRGSSVRVQGSFGQPLPLSLYLASAAIAAWYLASDTRDRVARLLFTGIGLGSLVFLGLTVSRDGFLVLPIAALWIGVTHPRFVFSARRLVIAGLLVTALLAVGAFSSTEQLLFNPGQSEIQTAQYRTSLITYALRPGVLQPFGSSVPFLGPGDVKSIDDEYVYLATRWGIAAFILFECVFAGVIAAGLRARGSRADSVLFGITLGNLIALYALAFLTQSQMVIWLLIGACSAAGASQSGGSRRSAQSDAPRELSRQAALL
jgi:hypothetical protein